MFVQFGCGHVFINPIAGNEATDPTPIELLGLQDISIEISQTLKELKGANKGPDDVAPAEMKLTGKASIGRVDVDLFNQFFFGETPATGISIVQSDEAGTVPGSSTYTVTVANSAHFTTDLGVRYASNMQPFTRVPSGPTAGQYSVAAGVYTFAAADANANVLISYVYTSSMTGKTTTVNNHLMGYGPVVEMWLSEPYSSTLNASTSNGWHLYAVRFSKLSHMLKRDDFTYPELEFEAYPNAAGKWFDIFDGSGF